MNHWMDPKLRCVRLFKGNRLIKGFGCHTPTYCCFSLFLHSISCSFSCKWYLSLSLFLLLPIISSSSHFFFIYSYMNDFQTEYCSISLFSPSQSQPTPLHLNSLFRINRFIQDRTMAPLGVKLEEKDFPPVRKR